MTDSEDNVELPVTPLLKLHLPAALHVHSLLDDYSPTQTSTARNYAGATATAEAANLTDDKTILEIDSNVPVAKNLCHPETSIHTQKCYQVENQVETKNQPSIVNESSLQQTSVSEICNFAEANDQGIKMGNQQSEKKGSDNDTPDEQNATCCKPPKRKSKDKSSKRKSNRSDEIEFDSKEVYPFDTKCKEESEVVEPVDLEPFEIVETEELSFIAGAGTSGVILSGSEGKFRISREIILEEKEPNEVFTTENDNENKSTEKELSEHKDNDGIDLKYSTTKITDRQVSEDDTKSSLSAKPSEHISNKTQSFVNQEKETDIMTDEKQKDLSPDTSKMDKPNPRMVVLSQHMFLKRTEMEESDINTIENNDDLMTADINTTETMSSPENFMSELPDTGNEYEPKTDSLPQPKETMLQTKCESADNVVYENVNATNVEKLLAKQAPIETVVPVKYILTQEMFKKDSLIETQTSNCDKQYKPYVHGSISPIESPHYDVPSSESKTVVTNMNDINEEKLHPQTSETLSRKNNLSINISNPTYGYDEDDSIISGTHEENIYEIVETDMKQNSGKSAESREEQNRLAEVEEEKEISFVSTELHKEYTSSALPIFTRTDISVSKNTDVPDAESALLVPEDDVLITQDQEEFDKQHKISENQDINSYTNIDDIYATIGEPLGPEKEYKHKETMSHSSAKHEKSDSLIRTDSLEVPLRDDTGASSREDTVPPPSPASMNTLAEEDEEDDDETDHTKSIDIIDFGDVVCKRLSLLLEDKRLHEDDTATTNVDDDSLIYFSPREFIDTSTGRYEMQDIEKYNENTESILQNVEAHPSEPVVDESQNQTSDKQRQLKESVSSNFETGSSKNVKSAEVERLGIKRNDSAETLKRASGDSAKYDVSPLNVSSDDDLPDFFDPDNIHERPNKQTDLPKEGSKQNLSLQDFDDTLVQTTPNSSFVDDLTDVTPTADISREFTALPELAKTVDKSVVQYEQADHATGRRSITGTESDLDISEQRTDMSTDSMYADDEAEETMDILFTKTYTEPVEGAEVFLSCTVVNSAYKDESKKREVWLSSDEALEYFEANASEVMSTAFMKAKQEMKDIQLCLQNLRKQMDNFHGNIDDISLPDLPGAVSDSLSPGYHDVRRKAVTD